MAHYVAHVESTMSPTAAFDYVADVRRFADWDPRVLESLQVEGSGPEFGAEYDVTFSGGGHEIRLHYVVRSIERPRRIEIVGTSRFLTSIDVITVAAHDAGSFITYDARLRLPLVFKLFDPLLSIVFRRIGDESADGLAEALGGRLLGHR